MIYLEFYLFTTSTLHFQSATDLSFRQVFLGHSGKLRAAETAASVAAALSEAGWKAMVPWVTWMVLKKSFPGDSKWPSRDG